MKSCMFSFYMGEEGIAAEELPNIHRFGRYILQTDANTPYASACAGDRECAILGLAVHVRTGKWDGLARELLSSTACLAQVIAFEEKLGGKYLIAYTEQGRYFLLGDATTSIPIFYNTVKPFACSSNSRYLVKRFGYAPDPALQQIRDSGEISQAMPYDVTPYRQIRQLIPNHYLEIDEQLSRRFLNAEAPQAVLTAGEAAERTAPMIDILCRFYQSRFPVYCPITSGRDSRVVLAFLSQDKAVPCYTIRHPEHRGKEQDLVIPRRLCEENQLPYTQIQDVVISDSLKAQMDDLLGANQYSQRTLRIAQTIKTHYGDGAVINGDSIGQVGKCSLHRDIPLCFATPGYFRCKLHNYSSGAKTELRHWLEEIKASGECVNAFDLFSIENRMGRWAGQENLIYNSIGQLYVNIFNSRSILYTWTAVDRKERKGSAIHLSLIRQKKPELLALPFESDDNIVIRLSKANGLAYLLSSYAKYYLSKLRYRKGT